MEKNIQKYLEENYQKEKIHLDFPLKNEKFNLIREEICFENNICFKVDNFMFQEEVKSMIKKTAEIGYKVFKEYRNSERVITFSENTAKIIWKRLIPVLKNRDLQGVQPFGIGTNGVWVPIGINSCLRFSKYEKGGHFSIHRDGGFVIDNDNRSIYTILIYLNDDFEGGITNIYDDPKNLSNFKQIKPKKGTLVMFNHDLFHKGETVLSGTKYILRTDLMFSRIVKMDEKYYINIEEYKKAEELYQKSIELQLKGDPTGSTECYLQAMEIHTNYSNSVKKEKLEIINEGKNIWKLNLNKNISFLIFHFLIPQEKTELKYFLSLRIVSKAWNFFLTDNNIWRIIFERNYDYFKLSKELLPPDSRLYYLFKSRCLAENNFQIFYIYFGYTMTYYGFIDKQNARIKPILTLSDEHFHILLKEKEKEYLKIGQIPSIICDYRGHYWGAGSGINQKLVGFQTFNEQDNYLIKKKNPWSDCFNLDAEIVFQISRWLFENGFEKNYNPDQHPFMLIIPYFLSKNVKKALEEKIFESVKLSNSDYWYEPCLLGCLNSPFIAFVERELLILFSKGLKEGTVLFIDSIISSIVPIKDKNVIYDIGIKLILNENFNFEMNDFIKLSIELQKEKNIKCFENLVVVNEKSNNLKYMDKINQLIEMHKKEFDQIIFCKNGIEEILEGVNIFSCMPDMRLYFKKNSLYYF